MGNVDILVGALEYIEANLSESIKTEDVAEHLYCSKSTVEKLFRYFNDISVRDYLVRRRMSRAAMDIVKFPERSLLEIGLNYGYGSHEAFSRAFHTVWHVTPSDFRKNPSKYELYPRFRMDADLMENIDMQNRKKVDISELYDLIAKRQGCYLIMEDIVGLLPINEISWDAGDLAIITSLNRMENAAGEDDIVFRVGADEFVILTASGDEEYAKGIVNEILSHNGEPFAYDGQQIPLNLYVSYMKLEKKGPLRYAELFNEIQQKIQDNKGL